MVYSKLTARLTASIALVLMAIPVAAQTRGYTARPSGFDLNFNGAVGDAGSADVNICDAQGDSASTTGEDIDGNGVNDRQVYVDLTNGSDQAACGLPGSPCHTIGYVMDGSDSSVPGGPIGPPAARQIQAICFKGVGWETVVPSQPGAAGTYRLAQTGTQARAFNLPRYPFVLSGWDANNNNLYPPYDADDIAVLDGALDGATSLAFAVDNANRLSNIEYAHFTARNYGQNGDPNEGFMRVLAGGGMVSQIFVHDLQLTDIMKGQANSSGHIVFNLFSGLSMSDLLVANLNVTDAGGGYFARGSGPQHGPYRFQNISVTAHGAANDFWAGFKFWDYVTGIEILDSVFDANPDAWLPHAVGGAGTFGVGVSYCASDWTIRGNTFTDFKQAFIVSPYIGEPGYCESRPTDNVVIDRNIVRNTYAPWMYGDWGIQIEPGISNVATTKTVTITNNFLSSSVGWEACIWANGGNPTGPQTGIVTIAGNTCVGPINRHSAIIIGNPEGPQPLFPQQQYVIKDNIIADTGARPNIDAEFLVTGLVADGNVYDPQSSFLSQGSGLTLAGWRASFGGDLRSKSCVPAFANPPTGNFRLLPGDTCAKAAGVSLAAITPWDIDGSPRSATAPSAGAFEARGLPSAPTNLRIVP
jgi:hypothetical protein